MPAKTHFIDSEWIEGLGEGFSSSNPATGDVNWMGNSATDQEILQAVNAAVVAFEAWADENSGGPNQVSGGVSRRGSVPQGGDGRGRLYGDR